MLSKNVLKENLNFPNYKFLLLFLICVDMICGCSDIINFPQIINLLIRIIEFVLFAILLISEFIDFKKYDYKKILFIILVLLCVISTLKNHNRSLLYTLLVCWIIRNDDLKDIFSFLFYCLVLLLICEVVYYFYLYNFTDVVLDKYMRGDSQRFTFGIGHPNTVFVFILNMMLMWLYSNDKKINVMILTILVLLTILFQLLIDSRTSFIICIVEIILFYLYSMNINFINNILKKVALFIFPCITILFCLITLLYSDNNIVAKGINSLINNRIYLSDIAFKELGITIFGRFINYDAVLNGSYFYIDSLYPYLIVEYGAIWVIIISVLIYFAVKKGNIKDSILIIIFSIYSISEHIGINFVLLCCLLVLKNVFSDSGEC